MEKISLEDFLARRKKIHIAWHHVDVVMIEQKEENPKIKYE